MATSAKRHWVPFGHRVVGLRPIAEAPMDGREVLVTDGVYWRVAIPKQFADGIWEYARDDANCPGHTWNCAPTHFILIEDLPQVPEGFRQKVVGTLVEYMR